MSARPIDNATRIGAIITGLQLENERLARALAESEERVKVLEAALVTLRERIVSQRSKPWAESGSFASRMTGEEGYDEALLEVESWLP